MSATVKPFAVQLQDRVKPFAVYLQDRTAAPGVTTQGWVRGVYAHAIEYTTSAKSLRGVGFLFGGIGTAVVAGIASWLMGMVLYDTFTGRRELSTWFEYLFVLPVLLIFLSITVLAPILLGLAEFFRPLDLPIIFDRQRRKVYRLVEDCANRKGKQRCQIRVLEHDWDDIVAHHHVTAATTGSSAGRHHTLLLMVRNKNSGLPAERMTPENQPAYVDGFALGEATVLSELTTPRVWEHLRRYMNENGPALPPGEHLADTSVPVTWWDSLGAVGAFGPGYLKRWRESWGWMTIMHLLSPLMLPLAVLMATTNWLSYRTAYPVQWPQEVRHKIGPPLATG